MDDLAWCENPFFNLLERHFLSNNDFVSINAVFLNSVGKNTLKDVALKLSSNLVHCFSNFRILTSFLNNALSSF